MKRERFIIRPAPELVPIALLEGRCVSETDLTSTELRVVVALVAARRVGRIGATARELQALTGLRHQSHLRKLQRMLWITDIGKLEGGNLLVWAPTPKAAARLGLYGWQTLLFSDEELTRVDANLPGFLKPAERTVELRGPELVQTTGEAVEDERATA